MTLTEEQAKFLKAKGYRFSSIRAGICEALNKTKPKTIKEISNELIENGVSFDKTSIYREIEKLVREGIAREINLADGKKRFEANSGEHFHLICNNCNEVECLDLEPYQAKIIDLLSPKKDYRISNINLTINGSCQKCLK